MKIYEINGTKSWFSDYKSEYRILGVPRRLSGKPNGHPKKRITISLRATDTRPGVRIGVAPQYIKYNL